MPVPCEHCKCHQEQKDTANYASTDTRPRVWGVKERGGEILETHEDLMVLQKKYGEEYVYVMVPKDTSDNVERAIAEFSKGFDATWNTAVSLLLRFIKGEISEQDRDAQLKALDSMQKERLRTTLHSLLEAERERIIAHIEEHGHATYNELTGDIEGWTLYGSLDQLTPNPNSQ